MKIIQNEIEIKPFKNKTFDLYFKNMSLGVFDIETTGLNPSYCFLILSGFMIIKDSKATFIQYFAENLDDEKEVLTKTFQLLSSLDIVLTYNGKHFDMNFIEKRRLKYDLPFYKTPYILDLYLLLNGHSHFRDFIPNLKQKSIEKFMGIASDREDEISGKESVEMYKRYLSSKDKKIMEQILLHNSDDIQQLYKLLDVIPKINFHSGMYSLGFPCKNGFIINKIYISGKVLHVKGFYNQDCSSYEFYGNHTANFNFFLDSLNKNFIIEIPLERLEGVLFSDIESLDIDKNIFKNFANYESGFLIVENHGKVNHLEVNILIHQIIDKIYIMINKKV